MAGTTRTHAGPMGETPAFLLSLLRGSSRGRGLTRLMVATDFSMCAELALARALRLPLRPGATLSVFHAAAPVAGWESPADAMLEGRCLQRAASTARRRLRTRESVEVREELRTGEVSEEAVAVARAVRAELVVAGRPHAMSSLRGPGRGSTVRHLARRLESSLLAVGTHPARPYQRPLVAVDLSEDSRRALQLVLRLCPSPVRVDVVHVADVCDEVGLWQAGMTALEHTLRLRREVEADARGALGRFLAPYREAGRECTSHIRCGEPLEEAILAEAVEQGADLLAVGMQAPAGPGATSVRSLAEQVMARAACDVLVVKASADPSSSGTGAG